MVTELGIVLLQCSKTTFCAISLRESVYYHLNPTQVMGMIVVYPAICARLSKWEQNQRFSAVLATNRRSSLKLVRQTSLPSMCTFAWEKDSTLFCNYKVNIPHGNIAILCIAASRKVVFSSFPQFETFSPHYHTQKSGRTARLCRHRLLNISQA